MKNLSMPAPWLKRLLNPVAWLPIPGGGIYSNIESLVLWAGSEESGCAVNECYEMME